MVPSTTATSFDYQRLRLHKLCPLVILFAISASVPPSDAFNVNSVIGRGAALMPRQTTFTSGYMNNPLSGIMIGQVVPPLQVDASRSKSVPLLTMMSSVTEDDGSSHCKELQTQFTFQRMTTIASVTLTIMLALTSNTNVAHAARKSATTLVAKTIALGADVSPLVLPSIPTLFLACLLPTLLGYYRSEYGVSYGYGTAIAVSSYLILSSIAIAAGYPLFPGIREAILTYSLRSPLSPPTGFVTSLTKTFTNLCMLLPSSLAACHAYALFFYGKRLNIFLLHREIFLPRFRAMRERIEDRSKKQGPRWKRTPFLLSCAFLYFCMMSPLLITSQVCGDLKMIVTPLCDYTTASTTAGIHLVTILEQCLRCSVVTTFLGFLLGALGDLNKTLGKKWQGEDTLITGGIFRIFRHPNYTGEVIGWISSCLAGILAVSWKTVKTCGGSSLQSTSGCLALWKSMAPYILLSVMGAMGITFVLATATTGLEFRQKEKYGGTMEYEQWIKSSWVGFKLTPKKEQSNDKKAEL